MKQEVLKEVHEGRCMKNTPACHLGPHAMVVLSCNEEV